MRAHHIRMHISDLPVIDDAGSLVGVVSESDFLRRSEIGTGRRHAAWLKFFMGPEQPAAKFVHERGPKVADVMTKQAVRNGVVHLHGLVTTDQARRATIVAAETTAGVKKVHDHLCDSHAGRDRQAPR
ncbi:BON domain-containing protein [Bradyrhizobium yuanmingense]|uniref:BON domain-containing protein n=1 Tax=Bradyrhizobium yuanmingense TaxID=108015 RepID=UPI000FE2C81D|nr:BON domain-containing protein [Bradyrhizobium yuanmingense]TGN89007.1 BON domain-containing protein [Bradyrhizobium yuanmingense]